MVFNIVSLVPLQAYTGRGITCWSGNDDEAHAARHSNGAAGVISVTSNIIPGLFSGLMQTQDDALMERCLFKGAKDEEGGKGPSLNPERILTIFRSFPLKALTFVRVSGERLKGDQSFASKGVMLGCRLIAGPGSGSGSTHPRYTVSDTPLVGSNFVRAEMYVPKLARHSVYAAIGVCYCLQSIANTFQYCLQLAGAGHMAVRRAKPYWGQHSAGNVWPHPACLQV